MSQTPSARKFFSRQGLLAQWHANYEFRPGQLQMAEAVEAALNDQRHLIVEAGTGTGKTLAYLIPAILSGQRVIISTGTKNLQEQLFFKDIPFLAQHFPNPLRVSYMKGRNNYACRQKIIDAEREPILSGLEEVSDFKIIRDWELQTQTGDRAELHDLPENSTVWAKLDARRELCTGQKCPQVERCFITKMQQEAAASDLIVVNHHLFFADLAVKQTDFGGVIPEYEAVIFDEAHEIEDVAGQYFGITLSNHQINDLVRDINATARRKEFGTSELDRTLVTLGDTSERFFAHFPLTEGRSGFADQAGFLQRHHEDYNDLLLALELLGAHLQLVKDAPEEIGPLFRRTDDFRARLKYWMEAPEKTTVYWIERRGRGIFLQATPIDVSPMLREMLFDRIPAIVLTSATLAVEGKFEFLEKRLGLTMNRSLVVEGSFDYQKQALLYVPQNLPDPRTPAFARAAAEEILELLKLSRGRAFVLFTSYQQMTHVRELVDYRLDYPTLLQGTKPRSVLLEEFRATPNCVLFATSSFWQGVDVQGDQLSCVIIDKLPFAVPSDPVVDARIRALRETGGNPFYDYQIPHAAIALKQGFGRLIRAKTDRGVLALLDHRITKQRYGQVFFDSLPDYGFTMNRDDVARFFTHV
ncbi:MAG: ATP-dependent DNA helicase [Bryobacteraceae bacterium]|nr:ATP-dependent DNA helicase [Bryobacteraceae bacterium]